MVVPLFVMVVGMEKPLAGQEQSRVWNAEINTS